MLVIINFEEVKTMPRLESTLLDRFVNGAFAGKRKIGRPLKYNIRHKGAQGWIELVFNPRSKLETYVSEAVRFIHPYLFYITYRFHVEKAREAGKLPIQAYLASILRGVSSVNGAVFSNSSSIAL